MTQSKTRQNNLIEQVDTITELVEAVKELGRGRKRVILGIAGAPGSGKSTLGHLLDEALGSESVLVGMDGFHYAQEELDRRQSTERKGAPDTFDVAGYVSLLRRLRACDDGVYAPRFNRDLEEPIACAVPVPSEVPIVLTEGNYLLLESGGWQEVSPLLDQCWFVDPSEDVRLARLTARHVAHGRSLQEARERSLGTDQRNADLVRASRHRAARIINLPVLDI